MEMDKLFLILLLKIQFKDLADGNTNKIVIIHLLLNNSTTISLLEIMVSFLEKDHQAMEEILDSIFQPEVLLERVTVKTDLLVIVYLIRELK